MRKIVQKVNSMIIGAKIKADMAANELMSKRESGDSHFVAVAVMLLIVLVIAAAFNSSVGTFISSVFTKITTKANSILN